MKTWKLEPCGIPKLIDYRGWTIWCWTGWKGTKSKVLVDRESCHICGNNFITGQEIYLPQSVPPVHWTCQYPDNPRDTLQAQWLASRNGRFLMSNCAVMTMAEIPAAEYERGECFEIVPEHFAITEDTPEDIRESAKKVGFERLKLLINQIEDAA